MGFFTPLPDPPRRATPSPEAREPEWLRPQIEEEPVAVHYGLTLLQTPGILITLTKINVFSCGIEVCFRTDLGYGGESDEAREIIKGALEPTSRRAYPLALHLAVTLPSGQVITDQDEHDQADGPRLSQMGAGGSATPEHLTMRHSFWFSPLPGEGPMTLAIAANRITTKPTPASIEVARLVKAQARVITIGENDD